MGEELYTQMGITKKLVQRRVRNKKYFHEFRFPERVIDFVNISRFALFLFKISGIFD